jgi:hypothetical protein
MLHTNLSLGLSARLFHFTSAFAFFSPSVRPFVLKRYKDKLFLLILKFPWF